MFFYTFAPVRFQLSVKNNRYMNFFELREWQLSDVASLVENANSVCIWNSVRDRFPHPYSEEDGIRFIETVSDSPKPAADMAIVVEGKAVGGIGMVFRTDVERISAEMGYWLGENYWNRGIMTAAVREMTEYVFTRFHELRKIFALVFDFNTASQRVLQKAGFEREAVLKEEAIKNGKVVDEHYYSLLKSQWLNRNRRHRLFRQEDFPVLENLLYEAVFQPEGAAPLPRDIVKKPGINVYIRDFGKKKGDSCLFACLNDKVVGGVWARIPAGEIRGFGYVDAETPELVLAVFREYRGMKTGTGLMLQMIDILRNSGFRQVSLSVNKANPAVGMYRNLGFETVRENEHDYVMVRKLRDAREPETGKAAEPVPAEQETDGAAEQTHPGK
jgi:RimJ/RimL family protein N-acetyltransferase